MDGINNQGERYVPVITEARGACKITEASFKILQILFRMTKNPTHVVSQRDITLMSGSIDKLGQGLRETAAAIGVLFVAIVVSRLIFFEHE